MPNNSRDVVGGLTSRGLMACSLVRLSRGAANVSLPGFTELEDMVKELVRDWKTADHNDNEFVWLATRLGDLCSLIREFDMVEHPDVCTASSKGQKTATANRKFHRLKDSLDEELKRWPRLGIHGAEHKQRLLDGLNREINQVAELTLVRCSYLSVLSYIS
ncbi:hypothetical protein FRC09_003575 [Ceratobasidium sp. 395]|nr:hypothetical protein FRC09_003575 [Ceratobasidium sp. 395]